MIPNPTIFSTKFRSAPLIGGSGSFSLMGISMLVIGRVAGRVDDAAAAIDIARYQ
ncbi:hypothetical protein D3C76_1551380 [compost metagenome]